MTRAGRASSFFVFGYGSLLWRPGFSYRSREAAVVSDRARRLWQGSTDHRGTPSAPGRVVTLVPEPGARSFGMLFEVAREDADAIVAELDRREQGGYVRRELEVTRLSARDKVTALTYVALPGNPNYLGPAPAEAIAAQVARSHGPSGSNREYVERLARALAELGADDPHVFEVARLLGGDR